MLTTFFSSHKKLIITCTLVAILGSSLYTYSTQTVRGRVLTMYAGGGFFAPVGTKIACAKQTDQKVAEKFTLPLNFDQESKDLLREFWHFSYYRACLFDAGYDFGGRKVAHSEIIEESGKLIYKNHFAKISFEVPAGTTIVTDNITNPDIDDYVITSSLQVGTDVVIVQADRSKKSVADLKELEAGFTGFATTSATVLGKSYRTSQTGSAILAAHQDDAQFGFLSFTPNKLAISIYGKMLPQPLLDMIESSFTFIE
jgi:hypothetical protein